MDLATDFLLLWERESSMVLAGVSGIVSPIMSQILVAVVFEDVLQLGDGDTAVVWSAVVTLGIV